MDIYFGLRESLEAVFGCNVDLIEPSAIRNPYFRESAERAKVPLYAARGENRPFVRQASSVDPARISFLHLNKQVGKSK